MILFYRIYGTGRINLSLRLALLLNSNRLCYFEQIWRLSEYIERGVLISGGFRNAACNYRFVGCWRVLDHTYFLLHLLHNVARPVRKRDRRIGRHRCVYLISMRLKRTERKIIWLVLKKSCGIQFWSTHSQQNKFTPLPKSTKQYSQHIYYLLHLGTLTNQKSINIWNANGSWGS